MGKQDTVKGILIIEGFKELRGLQEKEYITYLKIFSMFYGFDGYRHAKTDENLDIEIDRYMREHNKIHPNYEWQLENNDTIKDWIDPFFYRQGFFLNFYIPAILSEEYQKKYGFNSELGDQEGYEKFNKSVKWFVDPITNEKLTSHEAFYRFRRNKKYHELFNKFCIYNMTRLGYN